MARIRTVKPELFSHEGLFDAEMEFGLPLRLAFIGLFTCCDRDGRFKWRPRALKKDIFPYDDIDFSRVLDALVTRGFVVKYACRGEEFGCIPSFPRHQVINNRESASEIPSVEESEIISITSTREPRVDDARPTPLVQDQGEGKGKEGKGKEGEGKERGTRPRRGTDTMSVPGMVDSLPGLTEQVAKDYLIHRKAKKAPLTLSAWRTIAAEVQEVMRVRPEETPDHLLSFAIGSVSWVGFKAEWYLNRVQGYANAQNSGLSRQQQLEERNRRAADEFVNGGSDSGQDDFIEGDFHHE